ncbi:MAG: ABC-type transporter, integral rane subunit, partial [Firmicutes bacterium]|nr:ABC-type transporter, integral rane subunit [Bacillota bacterium]
FFTETFGTEYGMGYFIMDAWMRVNYLEMYSGIVVLSCMGLVLFGVIDYLDRKICHWQYK